MSIAVFRSPLLSEYISENSISIPAFDSVDLDEEYVLEIDLSGGHTLLVSARVRASELGHLQEGVNYIRQSRNF
jgi:hypothetical protein